MAKTRGEARFSSERIATKNLFCSAGKRGLLRVIHQILYKGMMN